MIGNLFHDTTLNALVYTHENGTTSTVYLKDPYFDYPEEPLECPFVVTVPSPYHVHVEPCHQKTPEETFELVKNRYPPFVRYPESVDADNLIKPELLAKKIRDW